MPANQIRVLIVDDDLFVREHLQEFLEAAGGFELVGSCSDGADAIATLNEHPADVVLMDIRMPIMDGMQATKAITEQHPATRVLALTSFGDDDAIAEVLNNGACGFLLKNTRPTALVQAVRAAYQGLAVIPPDLMQRWATLRHRPPAPALTERETQVLALLAQGLNNRQIAQGIFVSASTVKAVLNSLMRKFATTSRVGVLSKAHQLGLTSPPESRQTS